MALSEAEKLRKIVELDAELNSIQDLDILLQRILTEARRAVGADAGSIYVREGNQLAIKYAQNDTLQKNMPPEKKLIYSLFKIDVNRKTISGYAAVTGEPLNIRDVYRIPAGAAYGYNPSYDQVSGYKCTSMLAVPLKSNTGDILGVLQLINAGGAAGKAIAFKKDDELFATHFASSATLALQRAQMTRAIILRTIRMAELRDPTETGAHVNRVAGYAVELYERWAQKNDIAAAEVEKSRDVLRIAGMLHDVGKVAISDLILKKPGRFSDDEFQIMKAHTYLGARLFSDKQSEFDEVAQQVALTHHENWDGSGYPGHIDIETGEPTKTDAHGRSVGRQGDEIPLVGRIVAAADVYDALISRRVYKKAWDEEAVLNEMHGLADTKFDPAIVEIFFEVLDNIRQITNRYPTQA